ncbi:MAG: hypothetical protein IJ532_07035 [Alphaproteobacteria bacterium]|nr:hypothetical protein [Alphaproteobacteria bacterium]
MKKTMTLLVMLVVVMMANAQIITDMAPGILYLSNGTKVYTSQLPMAQYRLNATIQQCIAETQAEAYAREARHYQVSPNAVYSGGVYGGMYGGVGFGATGSSFSIGNSHWGIESSSSNWGGYQTKSSGIRIGSFHIGSSSAEYVQPTVATPSYTRSADTSSTSYQARKKADAAAATQRYSSMRSKGVVGNGTTTTTNTTSTYTTSNGSNLWNY